VNLALLARLWLVCRTLVCCTDKTAPFGVVLPAAGDLPVRDCDTLARFLATRHWSAVVWYVRDTEVRGAP
jgi:hypothetical protein